MMRSSARFPDPMAKTRRDYKREQLAHQRDGMTAAQVAAAACKLIRDRLALDGDDAVIGLDDFRRANLPMEMVTPPLVRGWIRSVQAEMAGSRP